MCRAIPSAALVLFLLVASSVAHGSHEDPAQGNQLRLGLSLETTATALDDGSNEVRSYATAESGLLTLQSDSGFYGQIGYLSGHVNELEVGDEQVDVDVDQSGRVVGIGYREPLVRGSGEFWGIGYRNGRLNGGQEDTDIVLLFWEKSTLRRYGVSELRYSEGSNTRVFGIGGVHVWFANRALGFGVAWALGVGEIDNPRPFLDVGIQTASVGVVLMLRGY